MTTSTLTRAERSTRGYEVAVAVLRTERVGNSTAGNPRYRFHTDKGIYVTADDVQLGAGLIGDETGDAVLRVDASRVIAWGFLPADAQEG